MEKETKQRTNIKKPSYEELNNYVNELMMENRNLRQKLNQVMDVHNKLPYLFEILKNKDVFDSDYIEATKTEIMLILPPYKNEVNTSESVNTDK